ncbi:DNA glycosylase [Boletus edulis BED1]|uniref:Adenine DNA glycosylase n=1 Tax=Boletus edulis BED1 TaxID=1328754 RepID=A0AAD4GJ88_BOLED|nr:DNA glycosylase [Boletus edulis BED1]
MPKRKRTRTNTDTDISEFLEVSDGSYCEAPKPQSKKTRQARKVTSKRARPSATAMGTITIAQEGVEPSMSNPKATHPTSWHVVTGVEPIREALLHWYGQIREVRGMPWRKPFDGSLDAEGRAQRAYEVWVSEVMLQQTQVATVIPYYNNWMAKFPTTKDLAASDIDTVNSLWKGLGYYSRAARLLSGAQKVVKELSGRLPDNAKDMQAKIPGIGRYSAGAICSIAYNQCASVLDGNVIRLLARFLALYAPPKGKQAQDILWAGAEAFVEGSSRPGDVNQALIELGSTVCKVKNPACGDCPLQPWCRAYQKTQSDSDPVMEVADIEESCILCDPLPADEPDTALVTIYPMKVERKKAREELDSVNAIEWRTADDSERFFLLVRRPEGGLLAGLHEFPTVPNISGASATAAKVAEIPNSLLESGDDKDKDSAQGEMRIVHVKPAGDVVHVFSHIRKTYRVQWVLMKGGGDEPPKLLQKSDSPMKGRNKVAQKSNRKHLEVSEDSEAGKVSAADLARWVPLHQVEQANIGTGVVKVWKLLQTLW